MTSIKCVKCSAEMKLQNETLTSKVYVCPTSNCVGKVEESNWIGNTVKFGVPAVVVTCALFGIHIPIGDDSGHGGGHA
jgi:DNA-directed RNA polymerase subunit RPC12/RpoP